MIHFRETANTSYMANDNLIQQGSLISPVDGSMLSRLVAAMMVDPEGCVRTDGTAPREYNNHYDAMSDGVIDQVVRGVQSDIDTARNVFNPIVKLIHERYTIDNAEVNLNVFTPNIVVNRVPAICEVSLFRDYLAQYAEMRVDGSLPGKDLPGCFPENISVDFLYSAFKLPLVKAQASLDAFVKSVTAAELIRVYTRMFIDTDGGFLRNVTVDEATIAFFLSRLFIQDLPEGINGSSNEITAALVSSRSRSASTLINMLRNRDSAVKRGELILNYYVENNTQRHTVEVYGETYLKSYLANGGSPEALLGALINTPNNRMTCDRLTDEDYLVRCMRDYKLNRDISLNELESRKLELTRGHLNRSITAVFKEIDAGSDEEQKALLGDIGEAFGAVNKYIASNPLNSVAKVNDYLIIMLGKSLIDSERYSQCLMKMNQMMMKDNTLSAKDAAGIYTIERTTDWWINQIVKIPLKK